jgi:hypothetical protein
MRGTLPAALPDVLLLLDLLLRWATLRIADANTQSLIKVGVNRSALLIVACLL